MSYLPATLEPDKRLIKKFGKKIRIENGKKFEKFEERYSTIAKMIPAVTKHSSTNSPKSLKTSSLWGKKI